MANEFDGYGNVKEAWQQCKGTGAGPPNTVCHTTLVDRLASRMGGRLPHAVKFASSLDSQFYMAHVKYDKALQSKTVD